MAKTPVVQLTESEVKEFDRLESIVQDGISKALEVCLALATIRDKRLYRREYDTFEEYCQERWNFTRQYASLMISASKAAEMVKPSQGQVPTTVRQGRALADVPEEKRQEVWQEAVEASSGNQPSASVIEAAARKAQDRSGTHATGSASQRSPTEEVVAHGEIEPVNDANDDDGSATDPFDEYLESCPCFKSLQSPAIPGRVFESFRAQAQVWYEFRDVRLNAVSTWNKLTRRIPSNRRLGHFFAVMSAFCTLKAPTEWVVCGVCNGTCKIPVSDGMEKTCTVCMNSGFISR